MVRAYENNSCLIDIEVDTARHRIPSKSLCNIPNKFADEMILRGWVLRNEIIWHKPASMPASVRDRFTVDFEKSSSSPSRSDIISHSSSNRMPNRLSVGIVVLGRSMARVRTIGN